MSTNYIDQITDTAGTTQDIAESESTRIYRATCSTAASTAAKVATLGNSNKNFSLTAGVRVAVTFTYGNSAATPTLRVDGSSTGTAKTIAFPTAVATRSTGNGTTYNTWGPYETVIFTYDGTYWVHSGSGLAIYNAYNSTGSHTHGNISNAGAITSDTTIATGDKLVITDASDSSKVARSPLSFDTSTGNTEKFLSKAGTWEEAPQTLVNSIYNSTDKEVILTIGSLTDVDNTEY